MYSTTRPVRTTLIGGLLFLVPFGLVAGVVIQLFHWIREIAAPFGAWIPLDDIGGVAIASVLAAIVMVLICYVAGRIATGRRAHALRQSLEEKLILVFPRYGFMRAMAEGFEGDTVARSLQPVLVRLDDMTQPAFEIERRGDVVVVFLPGSPDPWSGAVAVVDAVRIEPISSDLTTVLGSLRAAGKGFSQLVGNER
jgi:uncharacterized membrane protein